MEVNGVLKQIKIEIGHWLRKNWTFADVGKHWDMTEDYDDINEETYSYFRRFEDGFRLSDIAENGFVLDFCARTGNGTAYFYQQGKVGAAVCADVSAKMGDICTQRVTEAGLKNYMWVSVGDYILPFRDGVFDAILCFETVEHFPEPEKLVSDLGRVVRSGGTLILTTPNVLWEPIHALAAITGFHHSEGPHRFIPYRRLLRMVENAGFVIETKETTVLIPGGPKFLIKFGEWVEKHTRNTLMLLFGLRRIVIGRKI
jgi:SAM-dependent methyltransferase